MKFIKRESAPSKDDKHYYSNDNIFYKAGYGIPNCTAYAFGRAYELLGTIPKLSNHQAEVWIEDNKEYGYPYQTGMTPKLGAIAVWAKGNVGSKYKDGDGHVAIVEDIYSDGSWKASNSAWKGKEFYLTTHDKNNTKKGYNFLGFIYLPIEFEKGEPIIEQPIIDKDFKIGDKVLVLNGVATADSYGGGTHTAEYTGNINDSGDIKYITDITDLSRPRPYHLSNDKENTIPRGWVSAEQIKKI